MNQNLNSPLLALSYALLADHQKILANKLNHNLIFQDLTPIFLFYTQHLALSGLREDAARKGHAA
jgi:hypothetical protein